MTRDKMVRPQESGTFRPELPREQAARIARDLIAQGCVFCGITDQSQVGIDVWPDEGHDVAAWYSVMSQKSGHEWVLCVACYLNTRLLLR
jgi:hypothetical protein